LKVACPSNPYDAKGILRRRSGITTRGLLEHKLLYGAKAGGRRRLVDLVMDARTYTALGSAAIRREGRISPSWLRW
jgi:pyruvate/2-oxoglutarate/acetoin dehydrogenase E1 component